MATFTPYTGTDETLLTSALLAPSSGISVVSASIVLNASGTEAVNYYDGSLVALGIGAGLLLTSGTTPGPTNTVGWFGTDNSTSPATFYNGDADIDAVVNTVFQTQSYDATTLSFDFTVTDFAATSVSFDLVFGSDEYPEWVDQFVDCAIVMVNGVNYALFNHDPMHPLSVISSNLAAGYFQDNENPAVALPIEYDGVSHVLKIVAPINPGGATNHIKIGIADTGDHILDSGIFISNLTAGNIPGSGVVSPTTTCTDSSDSVTGSAKDEFFDLKGGADVAYAGAGDDIVVAGSGNDTVYGGSGNDQMKGDAGDDSLDGGDGLNDTAVYSGAWAGGGANYSFHSAGGIFTITDSSLAEGTDTLTNVEFAKFSDGLFTLGAGGLTPVTDPGTPPANTPGIVFLTGIGGQGQTLTAKVSDPDGVPATIAYAWQADGLDLGVSGNTFVVGGAQVGQSITVTASYTDLGGNAEALVSAAKSISAPGDGDFTITLLNLSAPVGASVMNPLTTLMKNAIDLGASPSESAIIVKSALDIDPTVDLQHYDSWAALLSDPGDAAALAVEKKAVQVAVMTSLGGDETGMALTQAILLAHSNSTPLDLTDESVIANLLGLDPPNPALVHEIWDRNNNIGAAAGVPGIEKEWSDMQSGLDVNLSDSIGTLSSHINQAPTGSATAMLADGLKDTAYVASASDLLLGFSDSDGGVLQVSGLAADVGGTVADNGDGSFTITPSTGYVGPVELTYQVLDGQGGTAAANLMFIVATAEVLNQPPAVTSGGALDVTFDGDGRVTTAVGTGDEGVGGFALQPDGKIVATGSSWNGSDSDVAVVRYNTDGSLDTTFGSGGKIVTAIGNGDDNAITPAIQADGKIVVVGRSWNGSNWDIALVRYDASGAQDSTFGSGGKVTTAIGTGNDEGWSLGVQADGKIVVAGNSSDDCALVRYNANGSLDTTFDGDGKVTTAFGTGLDQAYTVALQADGKIIAGGHSYFDGGYHFALVRYNLDGSLDTTFDADGRLITVIGIADSLAANIAIQPDGKIVVAGYATNSGTNDDFALVRYNSDGGLDTTFGAGGRVTTDFAGQNDFAASLALQADGRIVLAGWASNGTDNDMALARYNVDGSLDTTFDGDGKLTLAIGSGDEVSETVAIQSDGGIVATGTAFNGTNDDFAVVRVMPGGLPDQRTGDDAPYAFSFAANSFTDPETGALTYAAALADDSALPSWLSFDAATRTFSGTPSGADVGTLSVKVTATDAAAASVADTFSLAVVNDDDSLTGTSGNDWLNGGAGDDTIEGGAGGSDTLLGGAGDDRIVVAGAGADFVSGDAGIDRLILDRSDVSVPVIVSIAADGNGTPDPLSLPDGTSASGIELLELTTGSGDDRVTFANAIIEGAQSWHAGAGHDHAVLDYSMIEGGVGAGAYGNHYLSGFENTGYIGEYRHEVRLYDVEDLTVYGSALGSNNLSGMGGDDVLVGGASYDALSGGAGNDVLAGEADSDALSGGEGMDTLLGGSGSDSHDGGVGADWMYGGAGDDTFYVDGQSDIVFEFSGEGTDTVIASASFYLYAGLERLILANGAGDIFGSANELDNTLTGNEGVNLLLGWDGLDTISGAAGNDVIYGVNGNDSLLGDAGVDVLVAGAGNDTLDGGADPDLLFGEDGNDVLYGGSGFVTDILVGGAGNDTLYGSVSSSGEGDYDLMYGGVDDDTYYVDTPADLTFETEIDLGGGTDTVVADITGAGYYLYAAVENLELRGNTPYGVGNELDNTLTGSDLANWLLGGAGNDALNGKGGNDVLFGQEGADIFVLEKGTGVDIIGDFQPGTDKIQITGYGITSFGYFSNHSYQDTFTDGSVLALYLPDNDILILHNVQLGSLTEGDFVFG